jgi:hypothetical protein
MWEVRMRVAKWVGAIAAVFAVMVATSWLVHGILLRSEYLLVAIYFRPFPVIQARIWIILVGQAIFSAAFVYIYTRGLESKPWLWQGVRYGVLVWVLAVIPASAAEFVTMFLPHQLVLRWIGYGLLQLVLAGIAVAAIMGERSVAY